MTSLDEIEIDDVMYAAGMREFAQVGARATSTFGIIKTFSAVKVGAITRVTSAKHAKENSKLRHTN